MIRYATGRLVIVIDSAAQDETTELQRELADVIVVDGIVVKNRWGRTSQHAVSADAWDAALRGLEYRPA